LEGEIELLERRLDVTLPSAYRAFLSEFGKSAGDFLMGTDWTYDKLGGLTGAAMALVDASNVSVALPSTVFVFAMHQGYQFLYFDTALGNDPPVYFFSEDESAPRQVSKHFADWLNQCVEDEIMAHKNS
jgi:hypothetical protein